MAMALVLYIAVPSLCLLGVKKNKFSEDYLSKNATLAARGLGMLFIIFTHMVKENICTTTYFFYVSGGVGVAICFLVSGYGLHTSYKRKEHYLKNFWKTKVLRLLLPFLAVYGIYLILGTLRGNNFELKAIAIDLLSVTIPGVTFWYLKIQLLMYAAFYFAYRFMRNIKAKILGTFIITVMYIAVAAVTKMELFWYNTCLFFPLGLMLSAYQERILPHIRKNLMLLISGGAFVLLYFVMYFFGRLNIDWLFDTVYMICFCSVVLWLVQKFEGFRILMLLGQYSIEVYLIHTIIGGYFDSADPLAYLLLPLISVLMGIPIHWLSSRITNLLLRKGKQVK